MEELLKKLQEAMLTGLFNGKPMSFQKILKEIGVITDKQLKASDRAGVTGKNF